MKRAGSCAEHSTLAAGAWKMRICWPLLARGVHTLPQHLLCVM